MDYGATYCSLSILDTHANVIFNKSTSDKWKIQYFESLLYRHCHLMQEANLQLRKSIEGFIFIWDKYFPLNEESRFLQNMRREQNISHGIAFCSRLENEARLIITLAGKYHDIHFSKNVLKNKKIVYNALLNSLV